MSVLQDARRKAGMTQAAAAAAGGISQSQLANVEAGRRPPSYRALVALIEAYGLEAPALPDLLRDLAEVERAAPWRALPSTPTGAPDTAT